MSYSHESDGTLAPILQEGVEKFAKPWNRIRALQMFRDNSSLSAEPALWPSIERALSQSEWFVLIASVQAAQSRWVDREVRWWGDNRSAERLLIVVTHGVVKWDDQAGDFDWEQSDALPPSLRGEFVEEPRWVDATWSSQADHFSPVDPRLQDAIADISSRIRGIPKDDLLGAAVREHRRTRRIVRGIQAALGTLLVLSIIATVFALVQRSTAIRQATIATSRQLAALSESELGSNLDVALLLAVRAYRTDANQQTRSALLQADLSSSHLVRYLPMGGHVATLVGSGDGRTVVAGLADGRVMRQSLAARGPSAVSYLGGAVKSVAVSGDGGVIVASNGSRGVLWRAGAGSSRLSCPTPESPDGVGVSPSGRTVAVYCLGPGAQAHQSVELIDGSTGGVQATHVLTATGRLAVTDGFSPLVLVLPSDNALLMFGDRGAWQWRVIPGWYLSGFSPGGFGAHQGTAGYSSDGKYVTVTNGASAIPVWPTSVPTTFDPTSAPFTAEAPINAPTALTLSPRGGRLAVADSGTVYVGRVVPANKPQQSAVELPGNGSINAQTVSFLGDDAHLLSASGAVVALWNLNQLDRMATVRPSVLPPPCNGCPGALTAISPDGRDVAAVAENGNSAVVQTLDGSHAPRALTGSVFGPPVWDGAQLLLPLVGSSHPSAPMSAVRTWAAVPAGYSIAAAALNRDGHSVTVVDGSGSIYIEDPDTGHVERRIPGPKDLVRTTSALSSGMAAIDSRTGLVAIVDAGRTYVYELASGAIIRHLHGTDASFLAFAGDRLLVQRSDGSLEIWDKRAAVLQRTLPGDESYDYFYPVADAAGDLAARQRSDGSTTIADLGSGTTLATLPAPAPPAWGLKIGLAFSPNGRSLFTALQTLMTNASEIVQYEIGAGTLVRAACAAAGRNLTAADWRTYVGSMPSGNLTCH